MFLFSICLAFFCNEDHYTCIEWQSYLILTCPKSMISSSSALYDQDPSLSWQSWWSKGNFSRSNLQAVLISNDLTQVTLPVLVTSTMSLGKEISEKKKKTYFNSHWVCLRLSTCTALYTSISGVQTSADFSRSLLFSN